MSTEKLAQDNDKGMRLNVGKTRHELIEPYAIQHLANIFMKGAAKYADHNWLRGMKWSKMLASAKRHINAYERGEDYDYYPDTCENCKNGKCDAHTGELHVMQAAWNLAGIGSFYKWYPEGDDRLHHIMPKKKIGLDIDEVLCDWVTEWVKYWDMGDTPTSWYFDWEIVDRFESMRQAGILDTFYLGLPPKIDPKELPFEPQCYITARPVDTEVTKKWLQMHGFPLRPVITVPPGQSKADAAKAAGVDIFVDDSYKNYEDLNRNGVCCYLWDAKHNRQYNVGYRRITSFKQIPV